MIENVFGLVADHIAGVDAFVGLHPQLVVIGVALLVPPDAPATANDGNSNLLDVRGRGTAEVDQVIEVGPLEATRLFFLDLQNGVLVEMLAAAGAFAG